MASYQDIFTPLFIVISLFIIIGGLVGIQLLDGYYVKLKHLDIMNQ